MLMLIRSLLCRNHRTNNVAPLLAPALYRNGGDLHVLVVELAFTESSIQTKEFVIEPETGTAPPTGQAKGPLLYYSTHSSDTSSDPTHADFDLTLATPVTLSKSRQDKYRQRADAVLDALYPALRKDCGEEFVHVQLPVLGGGGRVANTTAKYASKLSAVTDIQVGVASEVVVVYVAYCCYTVGGTGLVPHRPRPGKQRSGGRPARRMGGGERCPGLHIERLGSEPQYCL
jgi:hypothetical protein